MKEIQLREVIGKSLPKIAAASINAVYPIRFQALEEPSRDYTVDGQAVGSQLNYSRNFQVCAFLITEASQIFKLGQRAFPKQGHMESLKMVVSANGEALNTIMSKVAYLMGKMDEDTEVATTPPIVLNCSGPNRIPISGPDSLFLKLVSQDISMLMVAMVQRV
jgi:hypothetical protein